MAGTGTAHLRPDRQPILSVEDLTVEYRSGSHGTVHAVSGISFDVLEGETLGLVGESGCGKTSTGMAIVQTPPPTSGSVRLDGVELTSLSGRSLRRLRSHLQMVFQDPVSSLNPRRRIRDIVREGAAIWGQESGELTTERVDQILTEVGLDPTEVGDRLPHEFSGGQCQRICIARALVVDPRVLICDEPVSALDVSVQAQILNLLQDLRREFGLTMLFIAHDLAVVKNISDRVCVMYLGKICEIGPADRIYENPAHPYTSALIEAAPEPDPTADITETTLQGEPPSPVDPPSGCRFRTRCPRASKRCASEEPVMAAVGAGHFVACHHPLTGGGEGYQ